MSFGDTYMALRKKRIAEVKETGEVKKTPTVKTGNDGMGKISTFGANYMELRQKRLQEEYAKATTLPDLSSTGPKAPYDIASSPFAEQRKNAYKQWRDSVLNEMRTVGPEAPYDIASDPARFKYRNDFNENGGADVGSLRTEIEEDKNWIKAKEKEIADDRYILDNWATDDWSHLTGEGRAEAQIISDRLKNNERLLQEYKKGANARTDRLQAYMGFAYGEMVGAEEENRTLKADTGNRLNGDIGMVYRTLLYIEDPLRKDLDGRTIESVKYDGYRLDIGRLSRMTENEKNLLTYLCNTGRTDLAEVLMENLAGALEGRMGRDNGEALDIPVVREAVSFVNSIGGALKNIGYGAATLFADMEAPKEDYGDYMQSYWQEKHKGTLAGVTTGAASSIGNMVPMVIATAASGGTAGVIVTFLNSRGSAYAEAKRNGATHAQAWWKGTLTGAAEAGLQGLLGAAGGQVKGVAPEAIKRWLGSFATKCEAKWWSKLLVDWMLDVGSEEVEEIAQLYMEPGFDMLCGMKDTYDMPTMEEFAETVAVTALSSTVFFGTGKGIDAKKQNDYDKTIKECMESWAKAEEGSPLYLAAMDLQEHFKNNKHISPEQVLEIIERNSGKNAFDSVTVEGTTGETQTTDEATYEEPNWEKYEQDHSGERFQYDPSQEQLPQLEDMQGWREDTYAKAQGFTALELAQAIEEQKAKRDDMSKDNKSRAIAQHHLDALELVQTQRDVIKKAAPYEQQNGGVNYGGTEGLNDGGQRDAGLGTDRQGRSLAEGSGRSITRGQGKTEAAIVEDLRKNATAQSAREIGIIGGSTQQDLYVVPEERVQESEQWSRIKAEAEAQGHNVVFVVGSMQKMNKVAGKMFSAEGIRQVDSKGNVTYYIRVDKIGRSGEQIFKHEDFHDIVHNNPELLGDLVMSLEMQYGKQELMAMINSYVEAYEGVYGVFTSDMTPEAEYNLIMEYAEELFADAYAQINRGRRNIRSAKAVLQNQTTEVQRAAQNQKATERKTAPPGQKFSFAGENAKTADRESLLLAKSMQEEGYSMEEIRQETGWHQFKDGKWRFEIDDSGMKYHRSGDARFGKMHPEYREHQDLTLKFIYGTITDRELVRLQELGNIWGNEKGRLSERVKRGTAKLADILDHDALFEAYPELEDTGISFADLDGGERGYFDSTSNTIVISEALVNRPESTLLHEIQHVLQQYENFTTGSSPEYWGNRLKTEAEAEIAEADRKYNELWEALPEEAKSMFREINRAKLQKDWDKVIELEEAVYGSEYADMYSAITDADFERRELRERERDFAGKARELYSNTAGEIEARDTAQRMSMTAEERKKTSPKYGDEKTVFAGESANAEKVMSLSDTKRRRLESLLENLGKKRIQLTAKDKSIVIQTNKYTKNKNIFSKKGRTAREVNARIKAIPEFEAIIRGCTYDWTDYKITGIENDAKKGVIAVHHFKNVYENFNLDIVVLDKGRTQFLYEVKFIENKKSSKQRDIADITAPTASNEDVWNDYKVSQGDTKVKQNFSVDDSKVTLEGRVSGDEYLDALDLIEEIESVGAQVDEFGYVTLYHRTSDLNARTIKRTGMMYAKEDGLFFSTNANGENNYGYGEGVVEFKVPAEMLVLDDIFADEASVKIPLENGRRRMNVSEYIVKNGAAEKQRFSVDDEAYMDAVESGNVEAQEQMVAEAAKASMPDTVVVDADGELLPMYHGTSNGGFTVFDPYSSNFGLFGYGSYFTENPEVAEQYTEKGKGTNKQVYKVFLNIKNPIDMDGPVNLKGWHKAFDNADLDSSYLIDVETNEDAFKAMKSALADEGYYKYDAEEAISSALYGMGYDGITHIGGGRFNKSDETRHRVYIVFESEQVKSAVPVTYDNNGNVIPLSERFDENKGDMRFSFDDDVQALDEEYARRIVEEDAPADSPTDQEVQDRYNALAVEIKKKNAKEAPIHTLKSRIRSSEKVIALQKELKKEMQRIGALDKKAKENIEKRIELTQETLKIDKAALLEKERERYKAEKKKAKEKKEKEIASQKARTAQKELRQDLLNLFSVREGTRTELGDLIDKLSDRLLEQGFLSHEDRKTLFDALMDHGEKIANPDEYFENVRGFMTQGRIYVSDSVRAEFGDDWTAFQRRAWGNRIYLTSDETDIGIDVWTECLRTEFGGQFNEKNDLKTQLEMIVDLAEEGKAEKLTIAEMMQREMDEFGWSVEEQVEELESKVDKLLDIFAQKADLEIRLRKESLRQRMKDYDLYRTMQERKRDRAMENQARKNVMSAVQKLSKMRKRAAPDQRKAIDEALNGIDVVARSISARGLEDLQELKRLYLEKQEAEGANFLSSPYVEARLARLGTKQIDDMDIEEVVELGRMVCSITNAIQNSNKLLATARQEEVRTAAKKVEEEIWNSEGSKDGKLRKIAINHLDGKRFFGQISGWVKGMTEQLGEALSTGQERQMRYQMNAMRIFDNFLSKEENQKFMKTASGKDAQWIKVRVPNGFKIQNHGILVETSEIEITPMMRISLLLHSKNEDNLRHIMTGGICIPNKEQYRKGNMGAAYDKGIRVKMAPATVRAIVKGCTEQEKAFARLCESYFNGMAKDYINEVSMVLDGFERAGGEHYYHIKTDPAFLAIQNDAVKRDLSVAATASVVNERVHASNPIVLQDATDALMEHVESISKYYGYAVPIRDLNAVLGQTFHGEENAFNGSVLETLKQKWGGSAKAYIDKLVADLQLPDSSKDYLSDFMVKLRGNYAKAVISANLSSLLKQTTSYPVALPYLKMDGLIHGLAFKNMAQDVKTLEKYSAVYWYRNQGNSTAELSDVLKRREFGDALPWLFNATQKMDSWTTRRILAACEYRVQKDMGLMPGTQAEIDAGTDRYWSEVAKLFNDVVLKTQSNSTMMERPQITRANARNISRFLTMFRTDAYQQYNMLVEAVGRLRAAKKDFSNTENADNKKALSNARRFATRTVVGTLIGQIGCALVGVLLKKLRYDDEEFVDEEGQWDWGKVAGYIGGSVVEGYCGFITCGEWLYAAVEASIDKEKKWRDIDVSGLSVINDAFTAAINLVQVIKSANLWEGKGAAKDFALALSKMAGISAENMEKYLYMCLRWVAPEFVTIRENFWDEITKSDLSQESIKTIEAAISVLMDNRTEGMSDEDKAEIARLYMEGGIGAVPSGIPSSVSYTNDDGEKVTVELSVAQMQEYRETWSAIVSDGIGNLMEADAYIKAGDEDKTALIAKLYSYANAMVAHELVPDKELDKWVQQGQTAQENGISLGEYIAFRVGLSDIDGKDASGQTVDGLKAQRGMELIESMGWTDRQEQSVWTDVVASESAAEKTEALMNAGLTWDQTNDIIVLSGNKLEKMAAIVKTGQKDPVVVKAMCVYASDKEKKLLTMGLEYDVKPEWYIEVLENANADGKGQVTQKEAEEYIFGMDLSLQEKAVLFQMVTDAKEGKSNPFYPSYAAEFYYAVHEDDPE